MIIEFLKMDFFDDHAHVLLLFVSILPIHDDARKTYTVKDIIIIYNNECTCDRSDVFYWVYSIYIVIRYTFDVCFFRLLYFFFCYWKIIFFLPFSHISLFSPCLSLHRILNIYRYTPVLITPNTYNIILKIIHGEIIISMHNNIYFIKISLYVHCKYICHLVIGATV